MLLPLRRTILFAAALAYASAAQAGPITSLTIDNCDADGCEGTTLTLSVEDNMDGTWTVLQSIDSTDFSEVRLGLNQVSFKAIKDWTAVALVAAPDPGWLDPPVEGNTSSNSLCDNGGTTDKVCTHGFTDITTDATYTWEFLVTGGTLMGVGEWHWGGQFADAAGPTNGKIISASAPIPEPNAAIVFGVGALVLGRGLRRPRR